MFKTIEKTSLKAFTLIEMLVVLLIISVLMLLFVPNLSKQKDAVVDKGNAAVVKVVEGQKELYALDHPNETVTPEKLKEEGKITAKQLEAYNAYVAKNGSD